MPRTHRDTPPAGLVAEHGRARAAIDGGPGAAPDGPVAAWLVTERAELTCDLRRLAAAHHLTPHAGRYAGGGLEVIRHPVVHTSHDTFGYLIQAAGQRVAWAPEFFEFPDGAAGVDLMFADAAGWARPIRFAHRAGGHAATVEVARQAIRHPVRRLVFARLGRPTITAIDAGQVPPFGEFGTDGAAYTLSPAPGCYQ